MDEKKTPFLKQVSKMLSSSQHFFTSFFDDEKEDRARIRHIRRELTAAAHSQALVVIQFKEQDKLQTLSGWLVTKKEIRDTVLLQRQDADTLQVIPLAAIRKLSMLTPRKNVSH